MIGDEKNDNPLFLEAAEFKGKDTLQNMRDTIMRHVYESKNSMFDQAKTVMLNQLKELTVCPIFIKRKIRMS